MKKLSLILLMISLIIISYPKSVHSIEISPDREIIDNGPVFISYKFLKISDSQESTTGDNSGPEAVASLVETAIQENNIDFILHGGDMVEWGAEQEEYDTYYWPVWSEINNSGIPIYIAVGNHDYRGYISSGDEDDLNTWKENVYNPGNEVYFSFDGSQNDTHYIVLNSEYYFEDINATRQQAQLDWLISDLSSNPLERIVVLIHRGMYGAHPGHAPEKLPIIAVFEEIFIQYGIDVVLAGHDHCFYYGYRNGIDHITSGYAATTGVRPIPNAPEVGWQEGDMALEGNHISIFEVTETGFNVELIFTDGSGLNFTVDVPIIDTYSPRLLSFDNSTAYEETDGFDISWVFDDDHPDNYSILLENNSVQEGSWLSGQPISYSVDALTTGIHTFFITVEDTKGYSFSVNTSIEILPGTAPITITTTTTTSSNPPTTTKPASGWNIVTVLLLMSLTGIFIRKRRK
ncbi:MAG: metallophosphoesterase family protein [Candidatus Hodarchaeales archaeon]|jgi:predicted phosphodiesterase